MYGGKDFFMSRTTWGAIILLLAPLLNQIEVDPDGLLDAIMGVIKAIDTLVGAALVVWGQLARSKEIVSILGIKVK